MKRITSITIELDTNNSAFDPESFGFQFAVVMELIKERVIAWSCICDSSSDETMTGPFGFTVRDLNGNTCGEVKAFVDEGES